MFRSACTPYLLHKHVHTYYWQYNKAKRRKLICPYKNRFFFLLQTVFSLKNNASKFQFILRHETVFVQINICVNNHRRSTTGLIFFFFFFFCIFFFFFFCIFTRFETLTICSCNYFTFKSFSINPQSTLVYGLLYRQGRKRGVLV